jgi:prepilin-type N-terminal cleavage/methylation domain-containing protein
MIGAFNLEPRDLGQRDLGQREFEQTQLGVTSVKHEYASTFQTTIHLPKMNRENGFTLIELLIGMTILGVILVAAAGLLQSNQRVTNDAQTRSNAIGDARGAMSRMTETLSQAAYIYPEASTITFFDADNNSRQVVTGADAVAALISSDPGAVGAPLYRGVIYYLADRSDSRFKLDLPNLASDRIAQNILVEANITNIPWPSGSLPNKSWTDNASEGVLVDGVDRMDGATKITELMTNGALAPATGSDGSIFAPGIAGANPVLGLKTPEALITTIGYSIGVRVASVGKSLSDSGITVLRGVANARNVPRQIR